MLLTMREREKTSVSCFPLVKKFHDRFHQTFAHAAVPEIRTDRQRTEEAGAAPVSRKIRTDDFTARLGRKRSFRIGEPTVSDVGGVTHESHRFGQTDECAERESCDGVGGGEFSLL